jgi:hypothetical protein
VIRDVPVLADDELLRIIGNRRGDVSVDLRGDTIRRQMGAVGDEIAAVTGGDERTRDELRRPAARQQIRQHFVVAGFRQGDVDRPCPIRLLLRMNMLEVLHVLADHEQVVLPFVDDFELLHDLAGAGVKNAKAQSRFLTHLDDRRDRAEIEIVVADVERRRVHERHAAARAGAGHVGRVIRMHRTHPRGRILGHGRRARRRLLRGGERGRHDQRRRHENRAPEHALLRFQRCGLVALPS